MDIYEGQKVKQKNYLLVYLHSTLYSHPGGLVLVSQSGVRKGYQLYTANKFLLKGVLKSAGIQI